MRFAARHLPLPAVEHPHGWGTALVAAPDGGSVLLSLPSGKTAARLLMLDLLTGEVRAEAPLRGEVRDAFFDRDDRGWLLTTFAICELTLDAGGAEVGAQWRPRGLGTYQHRILALGGDHVGVTGWGTRSLAVVARRTGALVKRIRVVSPHLALETAGGVRLLSPHGGEYVELELPSLAVTAREPMITGTAPFAHDGQIFLLEGVRSVQPGVAPEKLWRVEPGALVALDEHTLEPVRRGMAPEGARDVIGVDRAGRVVMSTSTGVALASAETLAPLARFEVPDLRALLRYHRWIPDADLVAMMPQQLRTPELITLGWAD